MQDEHLCQDIRQFKKSDYEDCEVTQDTQNKSDWKNLLSWRHNNNRAFMTNKTYYRLSIDGRQIKGIKLFTNTSSL